MHKDPLKDLSPTSRKLIVDAANATKELIDRVTALELERVHLSNELFDLRNRAGCGPDQEGPDIWQKHAELIAKMERMFRALNATITRCEESDPNFVKNHTRELLKTIASIARDGLSIDQSKRK